MGLCAGDPQRRPCQSEECLDLLHRPQCKIDGMNIPGANGFCGADPGGAKNISPLRGRARSGGRNCAVAVAALFWEPFRPTAPGCLILQSRESRSVLDKLRVLFIIGGIVVIEIYRNFPRVSGTPKQPS